MDIILSCGTTNESHFIVHSTVDDKDPNTDKETDHDSEEETFPPSTIARGAGGLGAEAKGHQLGWGAGQSRKRLI